jgi:hypothetical protein
MLYVLGLLTKITTCRVKQVTKDKIKYAAKCMKMQDQVDLDTFYSDEYVLDRIVNKYLKEIGIEPMRNDIKESDIIGYESYLNKNRVDTNLPPVMKEELKGIAYALFKRKMVNKKLNYYDVINTLKTKYLEDYPELKDDLLEYRYIKKQMGVKELQKQRGLI